MSDDVTAEARAHMLRQGEKFLRQGLLSLAIAEYARVVEAEPRDLAVAGTLGDLLLRAGDVERAAALYARIADALRRRGALPAAAALYRRILRLTPDAESVQFDAAGVLIAMGLLVEARTILKAVAGRRASDGDRQGTADVLQRIAALDPGDLDAAMAAAVAAGEAGDTTAARDRLVALSQAFRQRGNLAQCLRALEAALQQGAGDRTVSGRLVALCLETGDLDRAVRHASTAPDLKAVAAALTAVNRHADALAPLARAIECDPADRDARDQLARVRRALGMLVERRPTRVGSGVDLAPLFQTAAASAAQGDRAAPPRARSEQRKKDAQGAKPRTSRPSAGTVHYRQAVLLSKAGRTDEAMSSLEEALRSPGCRFEAATLLARLHLSRGDIGDAIVWFERATHAAPGPVATRDVLYELGCALVLAGEEDRALALFLELQTDAPGFKDVSRQIQQLSRRRAGK